MARASRSFLEVPAAALSGALSLSSQRTLELELIAHGGAGMSSALAVCEQPEKVHPGGATRSASRSSLAQVSKLAAPTPMAVGDSADSGTAEETVPQENQGSLKQSSSLSHIFDNVFGKVSNSVQNAKDYSETVRGLWVQLRRIALST